MTTEARTPQEGSALRDIRYAQIIGSDSKLGRIKAANELMREFDSLLVYIKWLEGERDEWKRKAKIDEQQAADRMKDWEVQYHAAMAAIEGRAAAEQKNEQLAGALLDISGYGIAPNDGYPVVSANVVKVARDALDALCGDER